MHPLFRLHLLFFPPACHHCRRLMNPLARATPGFPFLCEGCHRALPWKNPFHSCRRCGALTAEPNRARCPLCAGRRLAVARVWGAFHYADPMRPWIWALKYRREEPLSKMLGGLMADPALGPAPAAHADLVIPVPLHPRRLRQRGFNQSLLLAVCWAEALRARGAIAPPLEPGLLLRHRHTRPQVEVAPTEREGNVAGAFSLSERGRRGEVEGKRVLLVDDLLTSGATMNACADALLAAGAARVEALVLARA